MARTRGCARWHQQTVKLVASVAILVSSVAAAPGIGDQDRRRPVSVSDPPFESLGRVQTELGGRCTGFLIAPTLVMTAAHCLFQTRTRRFLQPRSVHVLAAYRAGAYRAHARVVRFMIPDAYRPFLETDTAAADRAVLVLDRPAGTMAQALPLQAPPTLPAPVRLAGYGQDRDEIAVESPGCTATGFVKDGQGRPLLAHDCQATSGTSGAPLVWRRPDGRYAAIGVQIEAAIGAAGGLAAPTLDITGSDRSSGR